MVFEAMSFNESECGSKIKGTKKRFLWTFKVDGEMNTLQLVASFVSGKRKVLHNDRQIYVEKELLNVKFEFTYSIGSHMFRILQKNSKFEMVVDGNTFDNWLSNRGFSRQEKKPIDFSMEEKPKNDPFAQFTKITKKESYNSGDHNSFGKFEDFGFGTTQVQKKSSNTFQNFGSNIPKQPVTQNRPSLQNQPKNDFDFFASQPTQPISQQNIFFSGAVSNPQKQNPQATKPIIAQSNLLDLL